MPDVWALPTSDAIREGLDFKALKVKELIEQQDALSAQPSKTKQER